jgi:hypothetical protein
MKKTLLLLASVFVLTLGLSRADSNLPLTADATPVVSTSEHLQTAPLGLSVSSDATLTGHGSDFARGLNRATGASFAQLNSSARPMPFSPMWVFVLIAAAILACRALGVSHAKAMADNEHQTHHARSQMYRLLHKRD